MRTADHDLDPEIEAILTERLRALADRAPMHGAVPAREPRRQRPRRPRPLVAGLLSLAMIAAGLAIAARARSSDTDYSSGDGAVERIADGPLSPRSGHALVWTGDELFVWGGSNHNRSLADGALYNPSTRAWRRLPLAPLSPRAFPAAAWNGTEVIVSGGTDNGAVQKSGAAYNPTTNTWRAIAEDSHASGAAGATWTGTELLVVGGLVGSANSRTARAFDPAANAWRALPDPPAAPLAPRPQVVWSTTRRAAYMFVGEPIGRKQLVEFNPSEGRWSVVSDVPVPDNAAPDLSVAPDAIYAVRAGSVMRYSFATQQWTAAMSNQRSIYPGILTDDGLAFVFWNGRSGLLYDRVSASAYPLDGGGVGPREDIALLAAGGLVMSWGGFWNGDSRDDGVIIHVDRVVKPFDKTSAEAASCIVFVNPNATAEQIAQVGATARAGAALDELSFRSQHDAYVEFRQLFADKPELLSSVTEDVLPSSFRAKLQPDNAATRREFAALFDGLPAVRIVQCGP